jgi:hypothetical protein
VAVALAALLNLVISNLLSPDDEGVVTAFPKSFATMVTLGAEPGISLRFKKSRDYYMLLRARRFGFINKKNRVIRVKGLPDRFVLLEMTFDCLDPKLGLEISVT